MKKHCEKKATLIDTIVFIYFVCHCFIFPVLYTTPSSISQIGSGLPTIIMATGGSNKSNSSINNSGGSLTNMQLQQALGSTSASSSATTYSFMNVQPSNSNSHNHNHSFGSLLNPIVSSGSVTPTTTTFNLTGAHNVSFQSLFGDDLLGGSSVVEEDLEAAGGVIIGAYETDDEEDGLSEHQLHHHLNGGTTTVDLAVDSSSPEEGEEDEGEEDVSDTEMDL